MNQLFKNQFLKKVATSFVRAFGATLLTTAIGLASSPNFTFGRAAAISAVVGAITAGFRAVQHVLEQSGTVS